jgi:hypothetical protein
VLPRLAGRPTVVSGTFDPVVFLLEHSRGHFDVHTLACSVHFMYFDSPPNDDTAVTTINLSDSELAFLHGVRVLPTLPMFWIAAFVLFTILSAMRTLLMLNSKDYRFALICFVSKNRRRVWFQGCLVKAI